MLRVGVIILLTILGTGSVRSAEVNPAGQMEWEKTVEAAKKEGQVNVYITGWGAVLNAGEFQKRYPEIRVVGVHGQGRQISQRVLAERRAGKYLPDVVSAGLQTNYRTLHGTRALDPIKPALILPEIVDKSKWFEERHRYADPEGQYVFRYIGAVQPSTPAYNTKLVNPKEIESLWDFLKPKWKGKMEARDTRTPGPGSSPMKFFYYNPQLGPDFLKRLFGETDMTFFRDFRSGTDWLARGKFAICFFCSGIGRAKSQGLPVDQLGTMKEGAALVSFHGSLALMNRAPHPNAARVFINWYLSREGQIALQKALVNLGDDPPDSLRIDIPKDSVSLIRRRMKGGTYIDLESGGGVDNRPGLKILNDILVKRTKK